MVRNGYKYRTYKYLFLFYVNYINLFIFYLVNLYSIYWLVATGVYIEHHIQSYYLCINTHSWNIYAHLMHIYSILFSQSWSLSLSLLFLKFIYFIFLKKRVKILIGIVITFISFALLKNVCLFIIFCLF